jgi:hypothetical protein
VGLVIVGVVGRRRRDVGPQHDEARAVLHGLRSTERRLECVEVVGNGTDIEDVPAIRREAHLHVVRAGQVGATVDRDAVVVEYTDQATESEMACERGRLVADPFHQTAVTCDHIRAVVHHAAAEACAQLSLGDRHTDGVCETLAERPGGDLDASGVMCLGVTRRERIPLPERLDVIELESVAAQEEHRVLQDRCMTAREDEAIAIRPVGTLGVVFENAAVEHVCERRECHRSSLMAALRVQRCIHREAAHHRDCCTVVAGREAIGHTPSVVVGLRSAGSFRGPVQRFRNGTRPSRP